MKSYYYKFPGEEFEDWIQFVKTVGNVCFMKTRIENWGHKIIQVYLEHGVDP